nr:MerR family transcriptional regulator [Zhihengliuella flava]
MNIGEVLSELQEDFPQVSASKIRFLEEKGLVTPQRTAAGYRKYTPGDIDRLRFILALQRDQYLPLKVIKDYLDAVDRGERPEQLPGGITLAPRSVGEQLAQELAGRTRHLTRAEMIGVTGADGGLIDELVAYGLIAADDDRFDEHNVRVVSAAVKLAGFGIEPRHLRAFRTAADREVGLVERAIAPVSSRKEVSSRAQAAESAREMSEACLTLHSALVQGALSRLDH